MTRKSTGKPKESNPLSAKKTLGQHFLTSSSVISRMSESCLHHDISYVVEIGPGKGALTRELLIRYDHVIAIEKDSRMVEYLHELFAEEIKDGKLTIIEGDILDTDIGKLVTEPYVVIANIPYYITGAITEHIFGCSHQPRAMCLLIQREVAERIVMRDGKQSILSLSIMAYGMPKILTKVARGAFTPPPKVESAIILVDNISRDYFDGFSEAQFFALVKAGFAHKRKLLIRNLESIVPLALLQEIFNELGIAQNIRAEALSTDGWQNLVRTIIVRGIL